MWYLLWLVFLLYFQNPMKQIQINLPYGSSSQLPASLLPSVYSASVISPVITANSPSTSSAFDKFNLSEHFVHTGFEYRFFSMNSDEKIFFSHPHSNKFECVTLPSCYNSSVKVLLQHLQHLQLLHLQSEAYLLRFRRTWHHQAYFHEQNCLKYIIHITQRMILERSIGATIAEKDSLSFTGCKQLDCHIHRLGILHIFCCDLCDSFCMDFFKIHMLSCDQGCQNRNLSACVMSPRHLPSRICLRAYLFILSLLQNLIIISTSKNIFVSI